MIDSSNAYDEESNRDIGKIAEADFVKWSGQIKNFTVNKSEFDHEGWDFIVQLPFPKIESDLPLDRRTSRIECLIQVKGIETPQTRISIKLSNWEKLVISSLPTFFLVMDYGKHNDPQKAFLVHVNERWIAKVLKRLRELRPDDAIHLHQKTLDLTWNEDDALPELSGSGLIAAIKFHVGENMDTYCQQKIKHREIAGDPIVKQLHIQFTFDSENEFWEESINFALGLRDSLPASRATLEEDVRFGEPAKRVEYHEGLFSVKEPPSSECQLILQDKVNLRRSKFLAKFIKPDWFFLDTNIPQKYLKYRILFELGEVILHPEENKASVNFSLGTIKRDSSLYELANNWRMVNILSNVDKNGCLIKILDNEGNQIGPGSLIPGENLSIDRGLSKIAQTIENAWYLSRLFEIPADTQVTLFQLFRQREVIDLLQGFSDINNLIESFSGYLSNDIPEDKELAIPIVRVVQFGNTSVLVSLAIAGYSEYTGKKQDEVLEFVIKRPHRVLLENRLLDQNETIDVDRVVEYLLDRLEQKGYGVVRIR